MPGTTRSTRRRCSPTGLSRTSPSSHVLRGRGDERRLPAQLVTTMHTEGEPTSPDDPGVVHSDTGGGACQREGELS